MSSGLNFFAHCLLSSFACVYTIITTTNTATAAKTTTTISIVLLLIIIVIIIVTSTIRINIIMKCAIRVCTCLNFNIIETLLE